MSVSAAPRLISPDRAPDLFEPLLGFRLWRVTASGGLRCLIGRELWLAGTNRASCWRGRHQAPGRICDCGFNALHELPLPAIAPRRNTVLGAIAAWGTVEVHRSGFRAQFASVVALAEGSGAHGARSHRLRRAAERYGVPVVPVGSLRAQAERNARAVDPAVLIAVARAAERPG